MHTPLRSVATLAGQRRRHGAGTGCRSGESRLTWNVQGPQGAPGCQGPASPQTMTNAVVNHDGSMAASGVPAGAPLTVTRDAPCSW